MIYAGVPATPGAAPASDTAVTTSQ
jgi:hypothetical protein